MPGLERRPPVPRQLHFAEGHWQRTWEMAAQTQGPEAAGIALQAGSHAGQGPGRIAPGRVHPPGQTFPAPRGHRRVEPPAPCSLAKAAAEALVLSRKINSSRTPLPTPQRGPCLNSNVARSAELANKPLEALPFTKQDGRPSSWTTSACGRVWHGPRRASKSRAAPSALRHLNLADSLTLAVLNATKASKEAKTFETHAVLPQDPFELAAAEAMASGTNPGAWPFACALILLGAFGRRNAGKRTEAHLASSAFAPSECNG